MKDDNWQLHLPELKPVCQKCPVKTVIHLQKHLLLAAYKRWNNLGEKGFSCSIFPDQHSVSHSLSNHILPAKGMVRNFMFASWFSALPFLSSAVPCRLLLRSWTTCSSFQFQNLNSICGHCQNENGRISPMICYVGSALVPALKCSKFMDRLAPSLHHNHPLVQILHFTVTWGLCTPQPQNSWLFFFFPNWSTDQVFQIAFSSKHQREGWNVDKRKAIPRTKER